MRQQVIHHDNLNTENYFVGERQLPGGDPQEINNQRLSVVAFVNIRILLGGSKLALHGLRILVLENLVQGKEEERNQVY